MKLPKSIKVGYKKYKVLQWQSTEDRSSPHLGNCDRLRNVIRVDTSYGDAETLNTLVHEVLHACWWNAGLRFDDIEEEIVNTMANQLTQVLIDNKIVIKKQEKKGCVLKVNPRFQIDQF